MLYLLYKHQILEAFINAFAGDCLVMPENPYSKDNPDMLVRKGSMLYAIFIPMFHEKNNFDHLLRRVFSSELSYGSKLHTVLILKEDDKLTGAGEWILNKVLCHISRGVDDALSYVSSRDNIGRDWSHIGAVKQWFYKLYDVNNYTIEFSNSQFGVQCLEDGYQLTLENMSSPSWLGDNKMRTIKDVVRYDFGNMCIKKKCKSMSFRDSFENIMTQSFLKNFFIDDGYLVPNKNVVEKIFGIATDREMYYDNSIPNDYCRTLVFSGILPLNILDEKRLSDIHNYYVDIKNEMGL